MEALIFGKIKIWLPKENIEEHWEKTKKMVDIYLGVGDKKSQTPEAKRTKGEN